VPARSSARGRLVDRAVSRRRPRRVAMPAAGPASRPQTAVCRETPRAGSAGSPLPRTRQLANLLHNHVALDPAQAIDEQRPVQMIHFVLEGAREQSFALVLALLPLAVARLD